MGPGIERHNSFHRSGDFNTGPGKSGAADEIPPHSYFNRKKHLGNDNLGDGSSGNGPAGARRYDRASSQLFGGGQPPPRRHAADLKRRAGKSSINGRDEAEDYGSDNEEESNSTPTAENSSSNHQGGGGQGGHGGGNGNNPPPNGQQPFDDVDEPNQFPSSGTLGHQNSNKAKTTNQNFWGKNLGLGKNEPLTDEEKADFSNMIDGFENDFDSNLQMIKHSQHLDADQKKYLIDRLEKQTIKLDQIRNKIDKNASKEDIISDLQDLHKDYGTLKDEFKQIENLARQNGYQDFATKMQMAGAFMQAMQTIVREFLRVLDGAATVSAK